MALTRAASLQRYGYQQLRITGGTLSDFSKPIKNIRIRHKTCFDLLFLACRRSIYTSKQVNI
ncbi:MAG: hypothetical protein MUQ67_04665, partial [Pirellulales bacterium]|nr:hypothetical protein [Pirellulales bacterium]